MSDAGRAQGTRAGPPAGAERTVERRRGEPGSELAPQPDLRDHLPGLEPERRVTDWGRSERMEAAVDRTVYDFLYRYWFRVETDGIANVPAEGGALLVANHAGLLPPDGIMVAKALREEHPRSRPVHIALERPPATLPAIGAILTKVGGVASHPANIHRLLFDEGQLVLAFPEGSGGTGKPLGERYRLRAFTGRAMIAAALRAGVPIVPIAILGAEEALPVFARLPRLPRLPALPLAPIVPLPAKFRLRFLEPVRLDEEGRERWRDPAFVQVLSDDIRALIQENLLEMVAARRSVWLG